jgi:O-antigen/teichoic acid export membrane protein
VTRPEDKASIIADDAPRRRRTDARSQPETEASRLEAPASTRRFSVHVAWTFGARLLMMLNSVGAGVIVARWLGAEGLGALAVINVAVATVVQLGQFGLPSANIYFIAQDRRRYLPAAAMNSLLFALAGGGALALALSGLAYWQPGLFGHISPRLLGIAAASIPFQLLTLLGLNIFLAVGRIDRFNQLDVLGQSFVLVNALVALVLVGAGLWLLVSLNTAATILASIIIVSLIAHYIAALETKARLRPDFDLFKRMMKYGLKFHVATLAGLLIFRADLLVVNHFRGAAEAGVYSVASQVAMMLMMLPSVIATLLFPRVAAEEDARRDQLTCRAARYTTLLMLMVTIAAVPASFVLPLLYGSPFTDASAQLLILLPGVCLVSIESVLVQYFSATGLPVAIPLFWLLTLAVNVALTLALVPAFGARGAALASTVSYALIFVLVAVYFRAQTGNALSNMLLVRPEEWRALLRMKS